MIIELLFTIKLKYKVGYLLLQHFYFYIYIYFYLYSVFPPYSHSSLEDTMGEEEEAKVLLLPAVAVVAVPVVPLLPSIFSFPIAFLLLLFVESVSVGCWI